MHTAFSELAIEETIIDDRCSRFILGPVNKGLGVAIGAAMRRALLSSIAGTAVVAARIEGVPHEFSTMPHVFEDVTDIILNVKGIELLLHSDLEEDEYKTLYLEASGAGEVKALDVATDPNVTILNPDHHIAALSEDGYIRMELYVKQGRRYLNWSDETLDENEFGLGAIRVDAVFNPINKVHVAVDEITEHHDNIELTVWTNGGVSPEIAVSRAASILVGHCRLFDVPTSVISPVVKSDDSDVNEDKTPWTLAMPIEHLNLSFRAHSALTAENINTLEDLVSRSEEELGTFRKLGKKSLEEIKTAVADYGLKLGLNIGG